MPRFVYKAKEGPGAIREGVVEAGDHRNAVLKIVQLGYAPLEVKEAARLKTVSVKRIVSAGVFAPAVTLHDIAVFIRRLYDLLDAEIPLLRALQLIVDQTKKPIFKDILKQVHSSVQNGASLSQALAQHPQAFPSYLVSMTTAGEVSGRLTYVFNRLSQLIEKQHELISKIRMSMMYPALIMAVGFFVTIVMLTFVVPRLSVVFDDMGQELPFITKVLMNVSHSLVRFWWLWGGAAVAGIAGGVHVWRSPKWKIALDRFVLNLPFLGESLKIQEMERLARTIGMMLESGVAVMTALECAEGVVQNAVIKADVKRASAAVVNGMTLAAGFRLSRLFPADVVSMIEIGEETGQVEQGFLKWAETYERESERLAKITVDLIGPLMILILAALVGFMFIAMLLPILRMNLIVA